MALEAQQGQTGLIETDALVPPYAVTPTVQLGKTQTQVLIDPRPLKLEVDTPTDWPTVLAPAILGLAALWFTWANHRLQVGSAAATYRNAWLQELRAAAVDFASAAVEIQLMSMKEPGFMGSDQALALLNRTYAARATMRLMLDTKHQSTSELHSAIDEVILRMPEPSDEFDKALNHFERIARQVLEEAWLDIKRDLNR